MANPPEGGLSKITTELGGIEAALYANSTVFRLLQRVLGRKRAWRASPWVVFGHFPRMLPFLRPHCRAYLEATRAVVDAISRRRPAERRGAGHSAAAPASLDEPVGVG